MGFRRISARMRRDAGREDDGVSASTYRTARINHWLLITFGGLNRLGVPDRA